MQGKFIQLRKEGNFVICNSMDEIFHGNMLSKISQLLHDINYMWNHFFFKVKFIETERKVFPESWEKY